MQTLDPNLVLLPHPATTEGRELVCRPIRKNETLRAYLRRLEILPADTGAWALSVNSQFVPPEKWAKRRLRASDLIEMRRVARDDSTMRMVGMLALAVAAAYTGGAAAAAYGAAAGSAAFTGISIGVSAAVTIAGGMVLNQVLPVNAEQENKYSADTASATYSLSASSNSARPYEPMPLIIGEHKIKPDFACKPYTEQVGDDLYLLQAFHFGLQPRLNIQQIVLGDTPIGDYADVQIEVSGEDGALKLAAGNVDTADGRAITAADGWVSRTTAVGTTRIIADLITQSYHITDTGAAEATYVDIEIEYRAVGTEEWTPFAIGDFTEWRADYWSLGRWVTPGENGNSNGGGDESSGGWSSDDGSFNG